MGAVDVSMTIRVSAEQRCWPGPTDVPVTELSSC